MLKEQKGITLVALIITIIVMLILAGVSISLVVGENGVLTQAEEAGDKQAEAAVKDAISLGGADFYAACYDTANDADGKTGGKSDYNDLTNLKAAIKANYDDGTHDVTLGSEALTAGTALETTLTINEITVNVEINQKDANSIITIKAK